MTELEWKEIKRKIRAAFDLPANSQLSIEQAKGNYRRFYHHTITFKRNCLDITLRLNETLDITHISFWIDDDNFLMASTLGNLPNFTFVNPDPQYVYQLMQAMFCLGLDIEKFEVKFNLAISAHEKLEWQLEFARRTRGRAANEPEIASNIAIK